MSGYITLHCITQHFFTLHNITKHCNILHGLSTKSVLCGSNLFICRILEASVVCVQQKIKLDVIMNSSPPSPHHHHHRHLLQRQMMMLITTAVNVVVTRKSDFDY